MRKALTVWLELFWKGNDTFAWVYYQYCSNSITAEHHRDKNKSRAQISVDMYWTEQNESFLRLKVIFSLFERFLKLVIYPVIFPNSIRLGTKFFVIFRILSFVLDDDFGLDFCTFFGRTDIFKRPKQFLKHFSRRSLMRA